MKNTKKLVGAIAALAIASALATGTTYAWFTNSGRVTVSSFDATVKGKSQDLQVAVVEKDATTAVSNMSWSTKISSTDIIKAAGGKSDGSSLGKNKTTDTTATDASLYTQEGIVLDALTTASTFTLAEQQSGENLQARSYTALESKNDYYGDLTLYTNRASSVNNGTYSLTASNITANTKPDSGEYYQKSGKYITFDLVFRSPEGSGMSVVLDDDSVVSPGTADNSEKTTYSSTTMTKVTANGASNGYGTELPQTNNAFGARAANAIRVAFTDTKGISDGGTGNTNSASDGNNSDYKNTFWCPNETDTTGAQKITAGTITAGTITKGYYLGNLASDYNYDMGNAAGYVKTTVATPNGLTPESSSAALASGNATIGKMGTTIENGYYYMRTTVVIWLEGTDGDCFDDVRKDSLNISLVFNLLGSGS